MIYQLPVLMVIVCFGALVNLLMFLVTFMRRLSVSIADNSPREEVIRVTINRAMRLEFILFLCQASRVWITYSEMGNWFQINDGGFRGFYERSFVSILLVVASVWDFVDRKRIMGRLDVLYPET